MAPGIVLAIDELAAGPGLAEGLHAIVELGPLARALGDHALERLLHEVRGLLAQHLPAHGGLEFLEQEALVVVDALHQDGLHELAAIGQGAAGHEDLQGRGD